LGGFLPPVKLPRRMWAGGRLTWTAPLEIGFAAEKVSTVQDVQVKEGKTAAGLRHRAARNLPGGVSRLAEEHDIVYRDYDPPARRSPSRCPRPPSPNSAAS
jgi:3-methylfumaryl-CoA hydratase